MVIKTDSNGNIVWQKTFNSVGLSSYYDFIEEGEAIEETADGGYILTGHNSEAYRIVLIKLTSGGLVEWMKTYEGNGSGNSVKATSDNGFVITGNKKTNVNIHNYDLYLFKVDSKGQ
ncbi:hypothetical protein [Neobacillus drentensis]|uniref:hypothetical protein n=1 Tax=Neobacillus drentensis TaxID=220684 RepID=UPI0008244788|nr:hypothetical protein [Neobacillus drentensis]